MMEGGFRGKTGIKYILCCKVARASLGGSLAQEAAMRASEIKTKIAAAAPKPAVTPTTAAAVPKPAAPVAK